MAASSLLLLRLAEFLRSRKTAIAEDAAKTCREEAHAQASGAAETFPWARRLTEVVQSTADSLLANAANDNAAARAGTRKASAESASIQQILSEAWLVRNTFA